MQANAVVESANFIYQYLNSQAAIETDRAGAQGVAHDIPVELRAEGIKSAAAYINAQIIKEGYSPQTWRTNPLHLVPSMSPSISSLRDKRCLDWIFFISALNFSFWSEFDDDSRFGVAWYSDGWKAAEDDGLSSEHGKAQTVWKGYWSLLAATNKALEHGIPLTDPKFYSSPERCPNDTIASIFCPHPTSRENIPLFEERIKILREVGTVLCERFGGSYRGLLRAFEEKYGPNRTALQLVQMVLENFWPFRDEAMCEGRKVFFWKRAQILVAETWAAFHPDDTSSSHPLIPNGISQLTMFADYRVPQILHDLGIISYSPRLYQLIESGTPLPYGSMEEMSIRAASILAVEEIAEEIRRIRREDPSSSESDLEARDHINSAMMDFFLWDLAKKVEKGEECLPGVEAGTVKIHRTRSIWY